MYGFLGKLNYNKLIISALFLVMSGCTSEVSPQNAPLPRDSLEHIGEISKAQTAFLRTKPAEARTIWGTCPTFNSEFSNHYRKPYDEGFPKMPVFIDYPTHGGFYLPTFMSVANFGAAFEERLPSKIRAELKKRNLLKQGKVEIAWVVQSGSLGEAEDYAGIPTTTRFTPHAWVDPDAPLEYTGTRVNRDVDVGIFDSERDISTADFPLDQMIKSPVFIRDKLFSPRSSKRMVKIGDDDPSQAFWSLVIDDHGGNIRAIATLHWILKPGKITEPGYVSYKKIIYGPSNLGALAFDDFGDLLMKLNKSIFKDTVMLAKLNTLFKYQLGRLSRH